MCEQIGEVCDDGPSIAFDLEVIAEFHGVVSCTNIGFSATMCKKPDERSLLDGTIALDCISDLFSDRCVTILVVFPSHKVTNQLLTAKADTIEIRFLLTASDLLLPLKNNCFAFALVGHRQAHAFQYSPIELFRDLSHHHDLAFFQEARAHE